ncbi:tripartite motif-containing protein 2-like [Lingula anatina]|uniref:Tripartite motif-containing protein 2-like n=1 Tax=Lingula anatina TaxID=7574 RepID=A0A1S3JD25_LINAN|nr:tripartite motif-containing protein 2-like [Lingula anatina]|eukprot:XP_013407789.1 tripartite motif-containing protein 2-like [Lingula anatina]
MAANIPPSREDGIPDLRNCPKCERRMTAPRLLLSCWHILCESCLADAIEGKEPGEIFQCFVCSKSVPVPWDGVAEFPVPLFLQCEPVPSTTDVTCYHHYEKKVTMYCKKCDTAICRSCLLTEDCHKNHPCVSFRLSFDEFKKKKGELVEHVQKLNAKIQEKNDTLIELDGQKRELALEQVDAERQIETDFQQLVDLIYRLKEEKKDELRFKVKVERSFLEKRRRDVVSSRNEMEMINQLAVELMKNGTRKEIMLHANSISSVMGSHETEENGTIFRKDKVEYVLHNHSELKHTIGKISGGTTFHSVTGLKLVAEFSAKTEVDKNTPDIAALAVDNAMNIVAPDRKNNNLKLFDRSGRLVSVWSGDGEHQLRCPAGVCCTSGGNIAICNKGNEEILFLDSQQRVDRTQTVSIGDYKCTGVVFSNDYVVCTAGTFQVRLQSSSVPSCVVVFSKHDGRVVREIRKGKDGSDLFSCPYGIALTKQGNLVVTDIDKHCVYVLTMEGEVLHRYGRPGEPSEGDSFLKFPYGVCVDQFGHILVTDKYNDRIHMLSEEAKFICHLVTGGNGLVRPQGIALDQEGHLIVSEGLTGKIKVFDYLI